MSTNIILSGDLKTLKANIALAITINRMLGSRDIGQFVGTPLEEAVAATPHTTRLRIIMYSTRTPPYKAAVGKKFVRATYNIPDVPKEKVIDWNAVKNLCGGSEGFTWGRWLCTVKLSNGRQMHSYGGTATDANNMMDRMLTFTTATLLSRATTELKEEGRRAEGKPMYRESTHIYPAYFSIINSQRINDTQAFILQQEKVKGVRSKLRGDFVETGSEKILLWRNEAPTNYTQIINNAYAPVNYPT